MKLEEGINPAGAPGLETDDDPSPALKADSTGPILVGLDDSDRSTDALALARLLAESLGASLVLGHNQPHDEAVREFPESEHDQLMRHEPEFRLTRAVSPADGLRQIAEQVNAQLIVIGRSKPSGLGRLRPRSVVERLLSETRLPVAMAPRGYARAERSLSVIASAFDGSPESRRALKWAAHLTTSAAGRLRVIGVQTPMPVTGLGFAAQSIDAGLRQGRKREQAAAIADLDGPVEAQMRVGSPAGVLVEASREADLLAMGSRGQGPLPPALLGSVAHHVARHVACPVVIHPPDRTLR